MLCIQKPNPQSLKYVFKNQVVFHQQTKGICSKYFFGIKQNNIRTPYLLSLKTTFIQRRFCKLKINENKENKENVVVVLNTEKKESDPSQEIVESEKNHMKSSSFFEGIDKRVWPIATSSLLMGCAIGVMAPVMPVFAANIGLSQTELGLVMALIGGTRLIINIPLTSVAERAGRKPLLVFGPLCSSFSIFFTGFSNSLGELLSYRFLTGVSGAAQMIGGQLYLSDISNSANRARTMAPMSAAFSAGMMIGPAIGGVMADSFGIRSPFYFVGFAVLTVAINNYYLLTETKPYADSKHFLRYLSPSSVIGSFKEASYQWSTLLKDRSVLAVICAHTTFWLATAGTQYTLLPFIATQQFGLSLSSVGGIYALMAGANVIFSQPAALISDKFGRKVMLVPGLLLTSVAMALVTFTTTQTQFFSILVIWGIGNAIVGTAPVAYLSDITTNETRAQALAMMRSGGDFGLMLGAGFAGVLSDLTSLNMTMGMNALLVTIATCFFWAFARESNFRSFRVLEKKLNPTQVENNNQVKKK